ncbi:RagB/SusD family nutrient uptake outer membrane protein [Prevotella sp. 10(H)]|uniref:RagB/SusD family nutrient uptake outer membrane protein n=1 Tax=Prevotella sp. 10(H) TaxID=1158294 RepID=UPI0004A74D3F|nr:RagB/SusD family nutrient uptake outer membrane protein [Prevotella sp. 10(H)]
MKNIKYLILTTVCFILIINTTGCSDYLDKKPDDYLTLEMVFTDKIRTEDWLAGVYSGVPNPMWGYFKDQGWNIMADDITIPSEWQPFGWRNSYAYTVGDWNSQSEWGPNYWVTLPQKIRSALIFIENARPNEAQNMGEAYVTRMKYEARFLIAYFYSLMIELYGPIPFKPGVIESVDAPASELMTSQSPYDDIVDWIDNELKEVAKHLPAVYPDTDWGRATSTMCHAVRARTLLFAASPLFNGNPDFKDWKNSEGVNLFKPTVDPAKWKRAADAHKELIDFAHTNGYKLYDEGGDPFMSYYNMSLKRFSEGNKEIIFGRTWNRDNDNYEGLRTWQEHHLPKGIRGNAGMGVTQELVDAFFMKNGLSPILGYDTNNMPIINPESGYSERGFSQNGEIRNTKWKGGLGENNVQGQITLPGTFNMYCNREPRFYVSVIYNEAWLGVANRRVEFLQNGGRDTGPTFDAPQNGYNVRKRISLETNPLVTGGWTYQPGIIYRLAEAYLGYAEALNEYDPGNADILKYINEVRKRAGIPEYNETGINGIKVNTKDKDAIRKLIQLERRIEFNCEGIRFHDVRRWKIAETEFTRPYYGMNFSGSEKSDDVNNPNAFYKRTFYRNRIFNKRMYVWPVPQKQIDINPKLSQAPGY